MGDAHLSLHPSAAQAQRRFHATLSLTRACAQRLFLHMASKDCANEGQKAGGGGTLRGLYEDEKRRIKEKGISGTIAEHKT